MQTATFMNYAGILMFNGPEWHAKLWRWQAKRNQDRYMERNAINNQHRCKHDMQSPAAHLPTNVFIWCRHQWCMPQTCHRCLRSIENGAPTTISVLYKYAYVLMRPFGICNCHSGLSWFSFKQKQVLCVWYAHNDSKHFAFFHHPCWLQHGTCFCKAWAFIRISLSLSVSLHHHLQRVQQKLKPLYIIVSQVSDQNNTTQSKESWMKENYIPKSPKLRSQLNIPKYPSHSPTSHQRSMPSSAANPLGRKAGVGPKDRADALILRGQVHLKTSASSHGKHTPPQYGVNWRWGMSPTK